MRVFKKTAVGFCLAATLLSYSSCQKDDNNNSNATTVFEQQFGSTSLMNYADIKQTDDGGFLLLGTIDADNVTNDKRDLYVVKTDSLGNQEWANKYGTTSSNGYSYDEEGVKLAKINSTEYLVAGNQTFYNNGVIEKTKIVLYKINVTGSTIGSPVVLRNAATDSSATFTEKVRDVKADGTDFILTGSTTNIFPNKPGGTQTTDRSDILIMRLNDQLQSLWVPGIASYGFSGEDEGHAVIIRDDAYTVISTTQESTNSLTSQLRIISFRKTDGAILNTQQYGQSGQDVTVVGATINPADEVVTVLGTVTGGANVGEILLLQVDRTLANQTVVKSAGSDFMFFGNTSGNLTATTLEAGGIAYLPDAGGFIISYTDQKATTNDLGLLNIDQNFNIVANYPKLITAKGNAAKAGTVLPIVVENNGNTVVEAHVMSAVFGTTSSQQLGIIKVVN